MFLKEQKVCLIALSLFGFAVSATGQTPYPKDFSTSILDSLEVEILKTTRTYEQVDRLIQTLPLHSEYLDHVPSILPVAVSIQEFSVTSPFGVRRHPIHKLIQFHGGIDVRAKSGMRVTVTAPGIVKQVGYDPALGAFVQVLHGFGFETLYGHLLNYCVQPGQRLCRGDEIGRVGQTGLSTGPHLHYVIRKNGQAVDPLHFCYLLRRRLYLLQRGLESGTINSSVAKRLSSAGAG